MRRPDVVEATEAVLRRAQTSLPGWVVRSIESALRRERSEIARYHLEAILDNIRIAEADARPICQDTGLPVFHVEIGDRCHIDFDLWEAIAEGVRMATAKGMLRPNVVDPLNRSNTGDNTGPGMPCLIVDGVAGDALRITAFPKGAGSENMSFLGMLNPADDPLDYILENLAERVSNACPPVFVGVGIGGTFDQAASLAKRAVMGIPGDSEEELLLLKRINDLGIGPMGLGGDTTALGVKIERAFCHTASLPVAVNLQCWANRRATVIVTEDGWSIE
ncbi:MAG: fumarate hydratase [Methanothrix sp.]|nr:fumarate hydratase [Methanothrix sp.]MCQ8902995.1 fumarate hydratase [Methanothrix sp.]